MNRTLFFLLLATLAASCAPQSSDDADMRVYGFIAPSGSTTSEPTDLQSKRICVQRGSTTELAIDKTMSSANLTYTPIDFESSHTVQTEYEAGTCDLWTLPKNSLRRALDRLDNPDAHQILSIFYDEEGEFRNQ